MSLQPDAGPKTALRLNVIGAQLASRGMAVRREPLSLWIHGDCLTALDVLRGNADALVADPPYGIDYVPGHGGQHKFGGVAIEGDDRPFDPRPFLDIAPISLFWGANHFAPRLPASPAWFIWDKRCGRGRNHQADCELAWTNGRGVARLKHREWNGANRGSERGEHWHPTQKSVEVMAWCLDQLGVPAGGLVVDPFMGSGTTGLACLKTGRAFVGIEIDPRWYAAALNRLDRYLGQGDLFGD